jgi:hypothetical protein
MKKIIRLTESDLVRIIKRVISEQEQGPTEQDFIKTLESNGFTIYTSQKKLDDVIGQGKINLSLAEWVYVKGEEGLSCRKNKKDGEIFFTRRTIKVRNPDYFGTYNITGATDVSMNIYVFKFPLEGEGKSNYDNAKKEYIDNLIPKKLLETPDKNEIKDYIERIDLAIKEKVNDTYRRLIPDWITKAREDVKGLPIEDQTEFNQMIDLAYNEYAGKYLKTTQK